jgi:RNA polymerase sigma-70 factor (ECF subfamily)
MAGEKAARGDRRRSRAGAARVTKRPKLNPVGRAQGGPPPDDYARLVRAAASGDDGAMERLLMRAQEVAWRFSLAVCGHADDAEDAMQEALIKTYRYTGQIRDAGAFRPWLYRTVRNACLVGRRKRVHEPKQLESLDTPMSGSVDEPKDRGRNPEQLAVNAERQRDLRTALRALPGPYRAVVFLREMEGLSTREVATVLEISEDNVKARLHRARMALQRLLEKDAR